MVNQLLRAIAALLVLSFAGSASAQNLERAKSEYKEGWKLLQKKRYKAALAHYERSYQLSARPRTLFNIALCYEGMGDSDAAIAKLQQFIETAESRDANFLADARAKLKAYRNKVGAQVVVTSRPTGATVIVDDTVRGHTPLRLHLSSGHHIVEVERRGSRTSGRRIEVLAGKNMKETFQLDAVGHLRLRAAPADALIRRKGVDDVGTGAYEADLSPGQYDFEISHAGYQTRSLRIQLKAHDRIDKSIRLKALTDTAEIRIRSDIRSASVSIDGLIVGSTREHDGSGPTLERRLMAGHHVIIVESRSGESWSKRVHLGPGEILSVDLNFRDRTSKDIASWTFSALGITSLVGGVTLGALGISDLRSDSESQNDRGQSRVTKATFLLGLGAASLFGGHLLKNSEPAATLERSHQ